MKKLFVFLAFISTVMFVSCSKDGDGGPQPKADRTVLVYMAADNNLSYNAKSNIISMIRSVPDGVNLLVYINLPGRTSRLLKISHENIPISVSDLDSYIDKQQAVKTYSDDNAASPDVMRGVIGDAIRLYPAESYGLILWSHGLGWIPAGTSVRSMASTSLLKIEDTDAHPGASQTKYFGVDENHYMEISELVSALPSGVQFEFIMFDACFMANVETLYDMRSNAKYIIASPAEVLASGFPYEDMVPLFFAKQFSPVKVCDAFMTFYRQPGNYAFDGSRSGASAAISYVVAPELDALAASVKAINSVTAELPVTDAKNVQTYEKANKHVFYDMQDYIQKRSYASHPELYDAFYTQLKKTVPHYGCTEELYGRTGSIGFYTVKVSCGLSAYIPVNSDFDAAYYETNWHKAVRP